MRPLTTTILAVILVASPVLAGPATTDHIPDSARWVAHVNVEAATASELAKGMMSLITGDGSPVPVEQANKAAEFWKRMGDVKSVTLYGSTYDENDAVALATLRYNEAEIKTLLKIDANGEIHEYGDITFHSFIAKARGKNAQRFICFYDNATLVAGGNLDALEAAVDLLDGKAGGLAKDNPLRDMLSPARGSFFVAAVPDVAQAVAARKGKVNPKHARMLKKADSLRLEFGEDNEQVFATVGVTMLEEKDAVSLQKLAEGLLGLAAMQTEGNEELSKILDKVVVEREDRTVTLDIEYAVESVLDKMGQMMEKRMAEAAEGR